MFNVISKSHSSSPFISSAFPPLHATSKSPLLSYLIQLHLPRTDQIPNLDRIVDTFVPLKFLSREVFHFATGRSTLGDLVRRPHDVSPQGYYTLVEEEVG
jgi:hypothetical protein